MRMRSLHSLSNFIFCKHSICFRKIAGEPNSILMNLDICDGQTSFNVKRKCSFIKLFLVDIMEIILNYSGHKER